MRQEKEEHHKGNGEKKRYYVKETKAKFPTRGAVKRGQRST